MTQDEMAINLGRMLKLLDRKLTRIVAPVPNGQETAEYIISSIGEVSLHSYCTSAHNGDDYNNKIELVKLTAPIYEVIMNELKSQLKDRIKLEYYAEIKRTHEKNIENLVKSELRKIKIQ